jgi:3-deoxy-manno-octulosonate cytidylyltransferase (CMP-KDO synthetase)
MRSIIVIPARYGSSRFVGKPLALINNKGMLERTWLIAQNAGADEVLIATDDDRIEAAAKSFGAKVSRSSADCENGTERVFDALSQYANKPEIVLNLQGDAVLTPPWVLSEMLKVMKADESVQFATPATRLSLEQFETIKEQKTRGIVGGTLVVFDRNMNALYFSKSPIPFVRPNNLTELPLYRHIGLYGYRYETLANYLTLEPGPLEKVEGLEQLRALENGIDVRVVLVDYRGRTHWSVDSPDDISKVEAIIAREGELVPALANS